MSLYIFLSQNALQRRNTKNLNQMFPEKELLGLSPNIHIHVSVSHLYISIGMPVLLQENTWTDPGNIQYNHSLTHESGNWDWGREIPVLGIHKWDFRCWVEGSLPMSGIEASRLVLISYSLSSWHTSYPFWNLNLCHYVVTIVQISFSWIHGHARKRSVVELQNKVVVFRN